MQWQRLRDSASAQVGIYLPVVVMALIALGSWWLMRNAPNHEAAPTTQTQRHEPDYYMHDFTVQAYNAAGTLQNELRGTEMLHLPDVDGFKIQAPQFVSFDEQGRRMDATAKRATANADASEVELFEQAQVKRADPKGAEPPLSFSGEHLRVFSKLKRVESDQSVVLHRGADVFRGGSLRYDHTSGQAQLGAPVTAMLPAAGQRQP